MAGMENVTVVNLNGEGRTALVGTNGDGRKVLIAHDSLGPAPAGSPVENAPRPNADGSLRMIVPAPQG
jgi:hypothetical protein